MKYLHSAISLVLIAFLFIGNSIGIDVFKHICNEEGTLSVAYVVNNIDHCEDESFNVPFSEYSITEEDVYSTIIYDEGYE